jgi:hypothetical protein
MNRKNLTSHYYSFQKDCFVRKCMKKFKSDPEAREGRREREKKKKEERKA